MRAKLIDLANPLELNYESNKEKYSNRSTVYAGLNMEGELMKPEINLEVGTWYLARALNKWHNYKYCTQLALAQYNAGPGNVLKKKWVPSHKDGEVLQLVTFPSTKAYIKYIIKYEQHYNKRGIDE